MEDDGDDVLLVQRAIRRTAMPVEVCVARDGEEAVACLAGTGVFSDRERHPLPAFVLLDLKLPRRSGMEVLAWIRAQPGLRRLPVVVMTSSDDRDDVAQAYDLGASSYLVKPVDFDALQSLMDAVLRYWLGVNLRPSLDVTTVPGRSAVTVSPPAVTDPRDSVIAPPVTHRGG